MRTERVSWVNNLDSIQDLFLRDGHEAKYESVEIIILLLYHVIVRPTRDLKILIFKILYFPIFFGSLDTFRRSDDIHDIMKKI